MIHCRNIMLTTLGEVISLKKGIFSVFVACAVSVTSFSIAFAATPANTAVNDKIESSNAKLVIEGKLINSTSSIIAVNNRLLVPARTTLNEMGASIDWYENSGIVRIKKGSTHLLMKIGEKDAYINGVQSSLDAPPILVNGTVMLPLRFTAEALKENVKWDGTTETVFVGNPPIGGGTSRGGDDYRGRIVVIDAGHGGIEPGAISEGVDEKNLNLDIANRLNILLTAAGVKTYMTRTDDSYVDLYDRSGLANNLNADLFISIHNNAQDDTSMTGSMTLYYPSDARAKNGLTPKGLATIIQNELTSDLGTRDLGIIQRPGLAVLRTTNMPAIITEVGYMTNHNQLIKLETEDFRQNAAESLEKGVLKALGVMR